MSQKTSVLQLQLNTYVTQFTQSEVREVQQPPSLANNRGVNKNTAKDNANYNSSNSNGGLPLLLLTRRGPVLTQVCFGFLDTGEDLLKEGLVLRLLQVIHRAARFR